MRTSLLVRTLIVILSLEWELGGEDPVIFCYRIGVRLRASPSGEPAAEANGIPDAA